MYELFTTDLRGELGKITSPALVLMSWTAYQAHATREQVEHNYQAQYVQLERRQMVMADHARHFIMLDDPAWFYGQLDGFLNQRIKGSVNGNALFFIGHDPS